MAHDLREQSPQESVDFGTIREERTKKTFPIKKWLKWFGIGVATVFGFFVIYGLIYFFTFQTILSEGREAQAKLEEAQRLIINRDLRGGGELVRDSNVHLRVVKDELDSLIGIRWIPFVGENIKAADALVDAGVNMTETGSELLFLADAITADILNESIPYAQLSDEKKKEIVQEIVEAQPLFRQTQEHVHTMRMAIEDIEAGSLVGPLRDIVVSLKLQLPVIDALLAEAVPMIEVFPEIVGFNETKTYLFLLQNNHELRPTGGFIGTYGILKLKNGTIETLITDNIYNLDRAFQDDEQTLTPQQVIDIESPEPLRQYLEQRQWALRDGNWDPHFPATAQTAVNFYNLESAAARDIERQIFLRDEENTEEEFQSRYLSEDFDGVIAITPEIIENLLTITGPVVVDGIRFTDQNFQEELSFRVTYEFRELDIEDRARKDIIKRISDQIITRIKSLPYTRLLDVAQVGIESLQSKAILIYSSNDELQELILERGWGGAISDESLDYLMVVDTNLGSLKTDQFINRFVDYEIRQEDGEYIATVQVTHEHTGEFAWNSTRLRSYTRVYVPEGSELLSSQGAMLNDQTKDPEGTPGEVDVMNEHDKTVFGAFISTEPQTSNSLTFTYRLPTEVREQIDRGQYNLLYQKQPGTEHNLTVALDFDKTIINSYPSGTITGLFNDTYIHEVVVDKDTWVVIGF